MSEQGYLAEVRRALFVRGVWGAEARRIMEQLSDHCRSMIQDLQAEGANPSEAEQKTLTALGKAETVAETAAADVKSRRRIACHPWLLGGVGVFSATFALCILFIALTFFVMIFGFGNPDEASHVDSSIKLYALNTAAFLTNWLPFVACCAFLGWWAWRSPGSWKALLIACGAVGLAASTFSLHVHSPLHGPGSGDIVIIPHSWIAILLQIFFPIVAMFSATVQSSMTSEMWKAWGELWKLALDVSSLLKLFLPVTVAWSARHFLPRWNPALHSPGHGPLSSPSSRLPGS